jgi:hypothetical protein
VSWRDLVDVAKLRQVLQGIFVSGFGSLMVQQFVDYFNEHAERRLYFCCGVFQRACSTRKSEYAQANEEDALADTEKELAVSNVLFEQCPQLCAYPHLRLDFGRTADGAPFLSEIEPCGDILTAARSKIHATHISNIAVEYGAAVGRILEGEGGAPPYSWHSKGKVRQQHGGRLRASKELLSTHLLPVQEHPAVRELAPHCSKPVGIVTVLSGRKRLRSGGAYA